MLKRSDMAKKMVWAIAFLFLALLVVSIVFSRSWGGLSFAIGAALGCGVSALKVVMIDRLADKVINEGESAVGNIGIQYLLRFLLTAVVLVIAALVPFISFWGAAAGVLTLQVAAIMMKFVRHQE